MTALIFLSGYLLGCVVTRRRQHRDTWGQVHVREAERIVKGGRR